MSTNSFQGALQFDDLLYPYTHPLEAETTYYYDDILLTGAKAGQKVTLTLESQQFRPELELRRADNLSRILQFQTGPEAAQLTFTVKPGVDYVLRVTSENSQAIGAYTLKTTAGMLDPVPQYQAETLSQQGRHSWQPYRLGQPITLTYSFMEKLPSYYKPNRKGQWDDTTSVFKPMTPAQRDAVRLALQAWEKVSGITFKAVPDDNSVQFRFGTAKESGLSGWAYYPDAGPLRRGDTWLNHADRSNRNPLPGSYGFSTILHEIGHALGLSHPFDEEATLPLAKQTVQYTVMAYDKHPNLPVDYQPHTPMLYDIPAIQQLYGKNYKTGQGDTVYQWRANKPFIETIYDTSGIDTVNARNQQQNTWINLKPGQFSSIGEFRAQPIYENVAIAFGVIIEHAIGGAGNDILSGNQATNKLVGAWGADILIGLGGNDRLTGGIGADIFVFQSTKDGIDTITDFARGQDKLGVSRLLKSVGYVGADPFLDGVLTATISQGNTVVSFDRDGFRGVADAVPFAILENFTNLQKLSHT
ncbi:MAG: M10 family metallopeptidase C-terminal domain-containing protein [Elainella sp. C42_A2020_010]|nr:M10 family metallopeptidase C-terminal domain-containing protein [Elainella sp. C42_A2020_010]